MVLSKSISKHDVEQYDSTTGQVSCIGQLAVDRIMWMNREQSLASGTSGVEEVCTL
jgi:hypothetical protein